MSNPRFIIEKLLGSGMNEREIVDALRERGVEITQATLNRIKNGRIKRTSYEIGTGLVRLHEQRIQLSG